MEQGTASELIARVVPRFSEFFQGRGLVDLRVFPSRPETLFIYVHFFCEPSDPVDAEAMLALAAETGVRAERVCHYGRTVWIEAQAAEPRGVVLQFPANGSAVPSTPRDKRKAHPKLGCAGGIG